MQAAINAARADLPASLRSNPTYRKVNPADAPILILALTSETLTRGQIYDAASTVLQQKLSQVDGVGQVDVGGRSLPAVRVELNPNALSKYGIGLEDVRAALASANANSPKGAIEPGGQHLQIYTNDQASHGGRSTRPLIVAYRNGAAVRLSRRRRGRRFGRGHPQCRPGQRQAGGAGDHLPPAGRQHHRHGRPGEGAAAAAAGLDAAPPSTMTSPTTAPPPSAPRCTTSSARC